MAVVIHLEILPDQIDPQAWAETYDDTLRLLRSHPSGLLGFSWRHLMGREIAVYTREIERTLNGRREYCVVGDRSSLRCAEGFRMPRDLDVRRGRPKKGPIGGDIVLRSPDSIRGWDVFGQKTQAEPYHVPVLAAAIVVESRFPTAALVAGDIDEDDAREAMAWAEQVLERKLTLPVLLDPAALLTRLEASWQGPHLINAFLERFLGRAQDGLAHVLSRVDRPSAEEWLLRRLNKDSPSSDPDGSSSSREVVRGWLAGTRDLAGLCELACLDDRGPRLPPTTLAGAVGDAWILISPETRHRGERSMKATPIKRPGASLVGLYLALDYLSKSFAGYRMDPGAVEQAFAQVFPGRSAELMARVRSKTEDIEKMLAVVYEAIERAVRLNEDREPWQSEGQLAALASANKLSAERRGELAVLAYSMKKLRSQSSDRQYLDEWLQGKGIEGYHTLLVTVCKENGPTLTEEAWAWLLDERDPAILEFALFLAGNEMRGDGGRSLKRALLESRVLCEAAVRMMDNADLMAATESLLDEARERENTVVNGTSHVGFDENEGASATRWSS